MIDSGHSPFLELAEGMQQQNGSLGEKDFLAGVHRIRDDSPNILSLESY